MRIIDRIINKLILRELLFSFPAHPYKSDRALASEFKSGILNESHIDILEEYALNYRSSKHFDQHIAPRIKDPSSFIGYAVLHENKIVYLAWIALSQIEIPNLNFTQSLNTKEAYFFDDHCIPNYQGKGLHSFIFDERIKYCRQKQIETIFIGIYANNRIALQNLKKYHANLNIKFIHIPLLKKTWAFKSKI